MEADLTEQERAISRTFRYFFFHHERGIKCFTDSFFRILIEDHFFWCLVLERYVWTKGVEVSKVSIRFFSL